MYILIILNVLIFNNITLNNLKNLLYNKIYFKKIHDITKLDYVW